MLAGFALGLVAANGVEWLMHRYVLHDLGKKKGSFWSFHWHDHHKVVRRTGGHDPMYALPLTTSNMSRNRELAGVALMTLSMAPIAKLSPGFFLGSCAGAGIYYGMHAKCHLDPEWGKRYMPWHVDHHMGPDQDKNWCVTFPLFDWLLGTREPFVGTPAEYDKPRATTISSAV